MSRTAFARPAAAGVLAAATAVLLLGCGATVDGAAVTSGGVTSSAVTSSSDVTSTTPTTEPPTTATSPTTSATPTTTSTSTSTSTSTTDDPAEPEPLAFGQSWTWSNGITVTVSAPKPFTPTDEDAARYGKEFVYFTVVLENRSKQAYTADDLIFTADNGTEYTGRSFYEESLPERPQISLVPGQRTSFAASVGLPDSKTVNATVQLDSSSEPVLWSSAGTGRSTKQASAAEPLERFIGVQRFGGTYTFATGISVRVVKPSALTPATDAYGTEAPRYLRSTIVITNGSRETMSPGVLSYGLSENAVQRGEVRSQSQKLGALPDGRYPPGSSFSVAVGFGVRGTSSLVVDVRLSGSGVVTFTDLDVPVVSRSEPGAPSSTGPGPTSSGPSTTAPGPVDDDIAVTGNAQGSIGQLIRWENGVTATVSRPASFTPSSDTRQPRGTRAVKYTVRVTNSSSEPLTSYFSAQGVSAGFSCDSIIDSATGVGDPEIALEPKQSTTLTFGCWAKDPTDVIVQLRPDTPYDPAWASTTPAARPRTVPASKEAESDEAARKFGQTFVYASGISQTVRTRAAIEKGSVAGDGKTFLAVEATFTNNTDEPFDLPGWSPRVAEGDTEVETFDNAVDFISPAADVYLLPGRSLTLAQGVIVTDPADLVVTSRDPSYDGPTITWSR